MQRLIWKNSKGNEINLTQNPFGITNWEGFSNTGLNIQTQQVPFTDGAVFLDALMEQRELSVTLAINDENDLYRRYELKRQLISALNPKMGEGYLIYTNDFISKRIKCVARLPIFPTKNSNDAGTQKASLSWVACEPYWEDLEETIVKFENYSNQLIENKGDVPVGFTLECELSGSFMRFSDLYTQKYLGLNNIPSNDRNVKINTNFGQKSAISMKEELQIALNNFSSNSLTFAVSESVIATKGYADYLLISDYKLKFQLIPVDIPMDAMEYFPPYKEFVAFNHDEGEYNCYKSSDLRNWIKIEGFNFFPYDSIVKTGFSKINNVLYVLWRDSSNKIYLSETTNLINWTHEFILELSSPNTYGFGVAYSNNSTIVVAANFIYRRYNGSWNKAYETNNIRLWTVAFGNGIFITSYSDGRLISNDDGVTWTDYTWSRHSWVQVFFYEQTNLFYLVTYDGTFASADGVEYNKISDFSVEGEQYFFEPLKQIVVCSNYYNSIWLTSFFSTRRALTNIQISYSYDIAIAPNGTIMTVGESWIGAYSEAVAYNNSWLDVKYTNAEFCKKCFWSPLIDAFVMYGTLFVAQQIGLVLVYDKDFNFVRRKSMESAIVRIIEKDNRFLCQCANGKLYESQDLINFTLLIDFTQHEFQGTVMNMALLGDVVWLIYVKDNDLRDFAWKIGSNSFSSGYIAQGIKSYGQPINNFYFSDDTFFVYYTKDVEIPSPESPIIEKKNFLAMLKNGYLTTEVDEIYPPIYSEGKWLRCLDDKIEISEDGVAWKTLKPFSSTHLATDRKAILHDNILYVGFAGVVKFASVDDKNIISHVEGDMGLQLSEGTNSLSLSGVSNGTIKFRQKYIGV